MEEERMINEMTRGELCEMLINIANEYRYQGVLQSIKRNSHMNDYDGEKIKDTTIDAILVDFINKVGTWQGLDLCLYTRDLKNKNDENNIKDWVNVMNNEHYEYYYEKNSKIIVLSHKGTEKLREELELHKYRCKICNSLLILITKKEGSFIVCSNKIFNHDCGYHIDMSDIEKAPVIKEITDD